MLPGTFVAAPGFDAAVFSRATMLLEAKSISMLPLVPMIFIVVAPVDGEPTNAITMWP